MLKDLEDALGVPLFDRFAWGMQATPYGDTMIRYARGVLTDLSEARDEIAALAAGAKGKLRIGSVTGAVPGLVAPALQAVRRGRPGLKVFVLVNTSDVLASALRQGTLDVAIGQVPVDAERGEFDAEPLRDEPLCLVARAGHPLARSTTLDAASLSGVTWILHPPESPMRADVNAMLGRARVALPGDVIETVSIVATLALLQGSDAISVLPVDLALHYASYGLLARLPLDFPAGKRDGALHAREPPARAGGAGLRGCAAESRASIRRAGRDACNLPCDSCSDASQTWSTAMRYRNAGTNQRLSISAMSGAPARTTATGPCANSHRCAFHARRTTMAAWSASAAMPGMR